MFFGKERGIFGVVILIGVIGIIGVIIVVDCYFFLLLVKFNVLNDLGIFLKSLRHEVVVLLGVFAGESILVRFVDGSNGILVLLEHYG